MPDVELKRNTMEMSIDVVYHPHLFDLESGLLLTKKEQDWIKAYRAEGYAIQYVRAPTPEFKTIDVYG
ncbi:hypothetical protein J4464_04785 [Candidatus Woesearchaeota archaeon]|nr:hypothetical protein [Candidatus Woesearchaeota archaeon]